MKQYPNICNDCSTDASHKRSEQHQFYLPPYSSYRNCSVCRRDCQEISLAAINGIPIFFIEWADDVLRIPENSFKRPTPDQF